MLSFTDYEEMLIKIIKYHFRDQILKDEQGIRLPHARKNTVKQTLAAGRSGNQ